MNVNHRDRDTEFEHAMIEAAGHHVQVSEEDDKLHIYVNDHLRIEVVGDPKENPRATIDSGEFETDLQLKDTEGSWGAIHYPPGLLR